MKKIIFIVTIVALMVSGFFFYNSRTIADDKDKCCNKECPKYSECEKKCDKTSEECKKQGEDCKKQCETKCDKKEGQSQMNGCPKSNCQQNTGCMNKNGEMKKTGECPNKNK
ncbi:MAG: hypothetical protein WCK13_06620 [Ignavibacteriota bacterium]|nr:hypothetical protein [Ignavibacteriota bacterium]